MIRQCLIWLSLAIFLAPPVALAQAKAEASAPDRLVKNVGEEVLNNLRTDKGIQSGDRQRAIAPIKTSLPKALQEKNRRRETNSPSAS